MIRPGWLMLIFCALPMTAVAQSAPLVPVHVRPAPELVDAKFKDRTQKAAIELTADLRKDLAKKRKTLRIVDSPEAAAVVVNVLSLKKETVELPVRAGDHPARPFQQVVMRARVTAGDYETEMWSGDPNATKSAMGAIFGSETPWANLAAQIDAWIKDNRMALLEK